MMLIQEKQGTIFYPAIRSVLPNVDDIYVGIAFFVETVKHFYVFCFYQLIPMQMPALAWSLTYYSESAVEKLGEKYKNH